MFKAPSFKQFCDSAVELYCFLEIESLQIWTLKIYLAQLLPVERAGFHLM